MKGSYKRGFRLTELWKQFFQQFLNIKDTNKVFRKPELEEKYTFYSLYSDVAFHIFTNIFRSDVFVPSNFKGIILGLYMGVWAEPYRLSRFMSSLIN